jgi:hypothetical protein
MDALVGYGSSSDSSDNDSSDDNKPKSAAPLSGLLANLSDASDDDDDAHATAAATAAAVDATTENDGKNESNNNEPPKKKIRLGKDDNSVPNPQHDVLPPPQVLASKNTGQDDYEDTDPFQSLILATNDYTVQLRQTVTNQLQSQTSQMLSQKQKRLADKLKLLHETFQQKDDSSMMQPTNSSSNNATSSSSFASHLKSKQEFGNPHLLKTIIDHFQITPLDYSRQFFKPFEFFDRLQVSEEKARIAAANYDAGKFLS